MQSIGRNPASVENQKPDAPISTSFQSFSRLRRGELVRALERIETQREFVDSSETASYLAGLARAHMEILSGRSDILNKRFA